MCSRPFGTHSLGKTTAGMAYAITATGEETKVFTPAIAFLRDATPL